MMGTHATENQSPSLEDGVIQSLYYLYQELLKENRQELACIMEEAIRAFEKATRKKFSISRVGKDTFKQFRVLQGFRQLDEEQRELFIREIGRS